MRKPIAVLFCWALLGSSSAFAQEAPGGSSAARAEVLVLGTYHMANPGRDIFNMQADDVRSEKRQAEIAQVITVLKRFKPSKIVVEREPGDARLGKDYPAYLAGSYELKRGEDEQIAYRLAKELGHKAVYGADADGEFPYPRLLKYAQATNRAKELEALMAGFGAKSKAQAAYLASHSILDTLLAMNSDEEVRLEMGLYYRQAHFGEPGDWAGADLLADWFRRNMRIHSNIVQLVDSGNERILVIYGAGHLGWLQNSIAADPTLRLRKLAEFVSGP
ncbi:hypothetical protein DBR47_09270 [Paucibacter sp. KBW04]|uniref:DUF5694 domain-containing protein n=1 Tax=Paucibacter sp. KBW04 TaxID=2153361 RepID=UPI000F563AAD|nr:DUF5694 domain-containing protein [Paucibacter sp. KBW04]RQO60536.1 hypothetical protein DBR47_09270 [Paucibacter sp. KBW04]